MDISKLRFEDDGHKYFYGDVEMPSTTTVLKEVGISPNYSKVKNIEEYASMGDNIHSAIENYIKSKGKDYDTNYIPASLLKTLDSLANNYTLKSEILICSEKLGYAGRADFILEKDNNFVIVDFKSGQCNEYAVSYQLSMYAWAYQEMTGKECKGLMCISGLRDVVNDKAEKHITSNFTIQPYDHIKWVMDCFKANQQYSEYLGDMAHQLFDMTTYENALLEIEQLEIKKKELDKANAKIKASLLEFMQKNNIEKISSNNIIFSYVAPYERKTVDTQKLKDDGLYDDYLTSTPCKESLKITIKQEK